MIGVADNFLRLYALKMP